MINPEDESVLSGYIDGELDVVERRGVESAMAADPLLSIRVRDLAAVRELVADLPRSTGHDVSPAVLQRIQARLARPRTWKSVRQNLPWLVTTLATAAAVVLAILVTRHPQPRMAPGPGVQGPVAAKPNTADDSQPPTNSAAASTPEAVALNPSPEHVSPGNRSTSIKGTDDGSHGSVDQSETLDQRRLRSLIDDPCLQRVFLVTDQIDGQAEQQVATLVEQATRHDYFKITISQGIVIDPLHPDRAVVFAVVLDQTELTSFRKVLKDQFRERVQDHEVDPAVALQLADIGQVVSLRAHPEARITIPDERLAIRTRTDGPTVAQEHSAPVPNLPDSPPGGVQAADTAHGAELVTGHAGRPLSSPALAIGPARSPDAGENPLDHSVLPHAGMSADDHHLVVLIWVTGPRSG